MLTNALNETISLPLEILPKDSYLYKLVSGTTDLPIVRNKKGAIIVNNTAEELKLLQEYLCEGIVSHTKTLELLDYYGIYSTQADYPIKFQKIKCEEEWYRANLYQPYFTDHLIQTNEFKLMKLTEEIVTKFNLANLIHYNYRRDIYVKAQQTGIRAKRKFTKQPAQQSKKVFLLHSYSRDYVQHFSKKELRKKIDECDAQFNARDEYFNRCVIRESIGTRRPRLYKTDWNRLREKIDISDRVIPLNYRQTYSNIRNTISNFEIVQFLTTHALWDNILLAGGSVLNAIIGYEKIADYDLFITGLTIEQANSKIAQMLKLLSTITSVSRSSNAITIQTESTTIQIILRLYRTKSEVLHGFDIDCCCVGFDGTHVFLTARAYHSIKHMINCIDFDRMSPSYEPRLAKYMKRGFSIYVPNFDWSQVNDDKIEERQTQSRQRREQIKTIRNRYYKIPFGNRDYDQMNQEINQIPKLKRLRGLDFLIYYHYFPINDSYVNMRSDYSTSGVEWTSQWSKTGLKFHLNTENQIISYAIFKRKRYIDDKIVDLLLNIDHHRSLLPADLPEFSISKTLLWKIIQPGEQATSTFHRSVYHNINIWYSGEFYQGR